MESEPLVVTFATFWDDLLAELQPLVGWERWLRLMRAERELREYVGKHGFPEQSEVEHVKQTKVNEQSNVTKEELLKVFHSVPWPEPPLDDSLDPTVLVLGSTQAGKSTLINSFLSFAGVEGPELLVGDGNFSATSVPTLVEIGDFSLPSFISLPKTSKEFMDGWKKPPPRPGTKSKGFKLIDAPGINDCQGRDAENMLTLGRAIHQAQSLSCVILVIDSKSALDSSFQENLKYYLQFLAPFRLPIYIVHTKWDVLVKSPEEAQTRSILIEKFIPEHNGAQPNVVHFFVNLCGWEKNFLQRRYKDQYEATRSNSLHQLYLFISKSTRYSTKGFTIAKPALFTGVDNELLSVLSQVGAQISDILRTLKEKNEETIRLVWDSNYDISKNAAELNRLGRELQAIDTDAEIDLNTKEQSLAQGVDEIFCPALKATDYRLIGIDKSVVIGDPDFAGGVRVKLNLDLLEGNWDGLYPQKVALIATGISRYVYADEIERLKVKIEELVVKEKELTVNLEKHREAIMKLDAKYQYFTVESEWVGWLCSFLERKSLPLLHYGLLLPHYNSYSENKKKASWKPEHFGRTAFVSLTNYHPPDSGTQKTTSQEDSYILDPVEDLSETLDGTTLETITLQGPVVAHLATKAYNREVADVAWCLLLHSVSKDTYILELNVETSAEEQLHIYPRIGLLNSSGVETYKRRLLQCIGIFPNNLAIKDISKILTEKQQRLALFLTFGQNCQQWIQELIPYFEEKGMLSSLTPLPLMSPPPPAPPRDKKVASTLFYLKIGSNYYLNLTEDGKAIWGKQNETTPYFSKVFLSDADESFKLQIQSQQAQNQFLSTDLGLSIFASSDSDTHCVFVRDKRTQRLYHKLSFGETSAVCIRQNDSSRQIFSALGRDVAVVEEILK